MPIDDRIDEFPRDTYLKLLQGAQRLFSTEQARRNLLAGLGLASAATERQRTTAVLPAPRPAKGNDRLKTLEPVAAVPSREEPEPLSSPASFAAELVELVARPSHLDSATTLARRALAEIGPEASRSWDALLQQLVALQRKYRIEAGPAPDVAGYREWLGFDCRHPYSLTDCFIGREEFLKELDDWVTTDTDVGVRCLWALGGVGKSALAWHWLSRSLPLIRRLKYEGAFWCSFYEKSFGFEEFLRRALGFCGQLTEADVQRMPRDVVEERVLELMQKRRLVVVLDGLERLMNGYAIVADRAVDLESLRGTMTSSALTRTDRRMVDPRDGAFIQKLARAQATRLLITSRLVPADLEANVTSSALPHAVFTELTCFRDKDAIELWKSIVPQARVSPGLRKVFRGCGYHPLVISVLARSVARCKGGYDEWVKAHRDFKPWEATTEVAVRTYVVGVCLRDLPEPTYQLLGTLTATGKPMQLKELADVLLQGSRMHGDGRWVREEQVAEHLQALKELGLVGEASPPGHPPEYDVHPVVRGAAWELLTDPTRERISGHILTEFWATPDRRSSSALDDLDRAIAHYKLLIQTSQLDRAWEMFVKWFWAAFYFRGAYLQLLSLFGLLLPGREVLQLLPLTSRRAQGEATYVLGDLLAAAGEGLQAKTLLRWCGTIRLQIGDLNGFLDAAHVRAWQTMYEGKLYETERALRELKLQALAFGAYELRPFLECWIGIILALRGEKKRATTCFEHARGRAVSNNWWVQGLAEGLVYLDEASEALDVLGRLRKGTGVDDQPLQVAWEKLTKGMALMGTGDHAQAKLALSGAYSDARRANYKIVQCFALPYLAEIALETGSVDEAEEWLGQYREIDRDNEYALCAADVWRVQAKCLLKRGDERSALDCAQRAFRLAACDGPPFVYRAGLSRALDVLQAAKGYVPLTDATLDPQWEQELAAIQGEETQLEREIASLQAVGRDASAAADAQVRPEIDAILRKASLLDMEWWDGVTGSHPEIQDALIEDMSRSGITLQAFREAFERGPHKSLLVVFHRLRAERVIHPGQPRPVGELDKAEVERWLADRNAHQQALDAFLDSEFAARMRHPFRVHAFEAEDVAAFLKDYRRRIEFDAEPVPKAWWEQLESSRAPLDMLVLAECVLTMPAKLAEVVREISVGSDRGITYAFCSLLTRRAIDRYESTAVSKTEGWSNVEVLLRLQDVKLQIGWPDAPADAKQFWEKLERDNQHHLRQVLQLVEELRRRGVSMADYYEAHLSTKTGNIQANLAYLDYLRHRKEPWTPTGTWPTDAAAERWAYGGVPPSFTDTEKLEPDQLASRLEFLLNGLGRKELDPEQEAWWKNLESVTSPQLRLRLAEELDFRRETLAELRRAQVDGDTDNLVAAIAYLDYSLLKRGDEQKAADRALERNRVGNAHYEGNRFRDAVASYEEAIQEKPTPVYFTNLAGAWERVPYLDRVAALEHAIGSLRRGLEVFPNSQDLRDALKVAERKKRTAELGGFVLHASSHQMLPVVTPIAIEFAGDLAALFEGPNGIVAPALEQRLASMRDRIKEEMGVRVPGVRFRRNDTDLPAGTYIIMLDEIPLVSGNVALDKALTLVAAAKLSELGIPFQDAANPVDGTPASWVSLADAVRLPDAPWDAMECAVRHLDSLIRRNLSLFAGMQEVINSLEETWSAAGRQIASDQVLTERFTRMTQAQLDEHVPMTHVEPVCDAYLAASSKGMDELLGAVRALPEIRCKLPGNEAGAKLFELAPDIERKIAEGLLPVGDEFVLALTPEYTQEVLTAVRNTVSPPSDGPLRQAIVVREPRVRRYVRKLVELEFPQLFTLTAAELTDEAMQAKRTPITVDRSGRLWLR